ncbi:MAG TPA: hypothetical protein PKD12_14055, partial [Nitrospira sp.]|nr:hypothetical protein [Nitrospira sp.]
MSRLKRELAEARMERDILKTPPRTLRKRSGPVRADEDAACPLSAQSVVPGARRVLKRLLCLAASASIKTRSGERTAGRGDPGCAYAHAA